jgi:molybdopterin adenylyltransferase
LCILLHRAPQYHVHMTVPEGTRDHRVAAASQPPARIAVVIVSDTRTVHTDESGPLAVELLEAAGQQIANFALLPNDEARVRAHVETHLADAEVDVVLLSGGTGLGSRDRTVEAIRPLLEKELPGFGELFRLISFQEQIGTAAILTRAVAGSARGKLIVSLPGSKAAVSLALTRVLLPELSHLLRELRR